MGKLDEIKEQLEKQLQEQLESNLKIRKELIKNYQNTKQNHFSRKILTKKSENKLRMMTIMIV